MDHIGGVLVCGAGPVGLLTALGLARQGVKVTVFDAELAVSQSPRANGYHPPTIELLDRFGLLEDAMNVAYQSHEIQFRFGLVGSTVTMSLRALEGAAKFPFFLHLGQHVIGQIVMRHLAKLPNTEVRFGYTLRALDQDDAGVTATVETNEGEKQLRADWLIGADGARSTVRGLLDLPFEGFTWPDRFVATNVLYDFEKRGYAPNNMVHHPVDWAVVSRLGRDNAWRVTFGENPDSPEDEILGRIPEHYQRLMPTAEPYQILAAAPYRVHERCCPTFRVGRVLLAGDAAHACNPCGGMGLTSGAFDAYALSTALGAVINGEAGDSVLDHYSTERRRVFLEVVSPTATEHKRRITNKDPDKQREVEAIFRQVASDPAMMREGMSFSFAVAGRPMLGEAPFSL